MRRPLRSLVGPTEEEERETTVVRGEHALVGQVVDSGTWRSCLPADDKFRAIFRTKEVNSTTVFQVGLHAAHAFIKQGHADGDISLVAQDELRQFERRLFDHIERETKPFVSRLRPRRRR